MSYPQPRESGVPSLIRPRQSRPGPLSCSWPSQAFADTMRVRMKTKIAYAVLSCLFALPLACDEKPAASSAAASASAVTTASAPPAASSAPAPVASVSAAPSGAASSPSASPSQVDTKEVIVTVKDPTAEPARTVKAQWGGSVTVYLPDPPGSTWGVDQVNKSLGKAKEQSIPGFAPGGVIGHEFKWSTTSPVLKAGQTQKVTFVQKTAGKPSGTFTLTIEMI
jgi:hypothetical protein